MTTRPSTPFDDLLRSAQEFLRWVKSELAASSVATAVDALEECKRWSRIVRTNTEARNVYAHANLLIVARIGQLSPRKRPGRPKKLIAHKSVKQKYAFSRPTLADYRKVAENASQIPEYVQAVEKYNRSLQKDDRDICEITIRGFLSFLEDEELSVVRKKLNDISEIKEKELLGRYDVDVIDPPWPQPGVPYPTMTLKEIRALPLPAADNCHVWLWTTQRFLWEARSILEGWGLKVGETYVWHKNKGRVPTKRPRQNCEFVIYASKGSPVFISNKGLDTCFPAKQGEHGEKPEIFYDMVRKATAGRRLDRFNRRQIDGFDGGGNEGVSRQFLDDGTPTWAGDPHLSGSDGTAGAPVGRPSGGNGDGGDDAGAASIPARRPLRTTTRPPCRPRRARLPVPKTIVFGKRYLRTCFPARLG